MRNTTGGKAKKRRLSPDFLQGNARGQLLELLLKPSGPEKPRVVTFKVVTNRISNAEKRMALVHVMGRSSSDLTSHEQDKPSSSDYYYTVTLPTFFGKQQNLEPISRITANFCMQEDSSGKLLKRSLFELK
jgi:hypothetical protein